MTVASSAFFPVGEVCMTRTAVPARALGPRAFVSVDPAIHPRRQPPQADSSAAPAPR